MEQCLNLDAFIEEYPLFVDTLVNMQWLFFGIGFCLGAALMLFSPNVFYSFARIYRFIRLFIRLRRAV